MKILICNDDGYQAAGLMALYDALKDLGDVTVVAPEVNVSTGTYGYKIITDAGANTTSGDLTISGIISGTVASIR